MAGTDCRIHAAEGESKQPFSVACRVNRDSERVHEIDRKVPVARADIYHGDQPPLGSGRPRSSSCGVSRPVLRAMNRDRALLGDTGPRPLVLTLSDQTPPCQIPQCWKPDSAPDRASIDDDAVPEVNSGHTRPANDGVKVMVSQRASLMSFDRRPADAGFLRGQDPRFLVVWSTRCR